MIAIKINDPQEAVRSRLPAIAALFFGDRIKNLDDRKAEEMILEKIISTMSERGVSGTGAIIDNFDPVESHAVPDSVYAQLVIPF